MEAPSLFFFFFALTLSSPDCEPIGVTVLAGNGGCGCRAGGASLFDVFFAGGLASWCGFGGGDRPRLVVAFFLGDGGKLSESAEGSFAGEVDADGEPGADFGGGFGGDFDGKRAFFLATAAFFGCAARCSDDVSDESEEEDGSLFAGGDFGLARTSFDAGPRDGRRRGSEDERALGEEGLLLDFERFASLLLRWTLGALFDFDLFLDFDRCLDFERRSTFT